MPTSPNRTITRWLDQLPELSARKPPPKLPLEEMRQAEDTLWELLDKLQIYELSPAQREERLGKNPLEMLAFVTEVMVAVKRHQPLVQGATYGADDLHVLQDEIDELGRLRVAAETLAQALADTILDRQARRYVLSGYLVDHMKAKALAPFASADEQTTAERALGRIREIEEAQRARVQATKSDKAQLRAEGQESFSRLESQNAALRADNEALRRRLDEISASLPDPRRTSR